MKVRIIGKDLDIYLDEKETEYFCRFLARKRMEDAGGIEHLKELGEYLERVEGKMMELLKEGRKEEEKG